MASHILLGKECVSNYSLEELKRYSKILGLRQDLDTIDDACSEISAYFTKHSILTELQLKKILEETLNLNMLIYPDEILSKTNNFQILTNYLSNIKPIGVNSVNGFIRKLVYRFDNIDYPVVLKSAKEADGDNLVYEFLVGQCINFMAAYYPCFSKTFCCGKYKNKSIWQIIQDVNSVSFLPRPINECIDILDSSNLNNLILNGCANSQLICIFTQHIPIYFSLEDFMKQSCNLKFFTNPERKISFFQKDYSSRLYTLVSILHMIYQLLSSFADFFTHYDLHTSNAVLVKLPDSKYAQINYHQPNGSLVSTKTEFIPVILDYGHSFVDCNRLQQLIRDVTNTNNSEDIIRIVCNNDSVCKGTCGDKVGYTWIPDYDKPTSTFSTDSEHNYFIDQTRPNRSHDLRILDMLKRNYDYNEIPSSEYIKRVFIDDFLNKFQLWNEKYGTPEDVNPNFDKIYNVHTAAKLLTDIIISPDFIRDNDAIYSSRTLYGTIDIWTNISKPFVFTPAL
jgi:hypothetical protein